MKSFFSMSIAEIHLSCSQRFVSLKQFSPYVRITYRGHVIYDHIQIAAELHGMYILCCYHHSARLHPENCVVCPILPLLQPRLNIKCKTMYNGISSYENYTKQSEGTIATPSPNYENKEEEKLPAVSVRSFPESHSPGYAFN